MLARVEVNPFSMENQKMVRIPQKDRARVRLTPEVMRWVHSRLNPLLPDILVSTRKVHASQNFVAVCYREPFYRYCYRNRDCLIQGEAKLPTPSVGGGNGDFALVYVPFLVMAAQSLKEIPGRYFEAQSTLSHAGFLEIHPDGSFAFSDHFAHGVPNWGRALDRRVLRRSPATQDLYSRLVSLGLPARIDLPLPTTTHDWECNDLRGVEAVFPENEEVIVIGRASCGHNSRLGMQGRLRR